MTQQIMDCIQEALNPKGVMVMLEARHMCMQMRGVEKDDSVTNTIAYCGDFERQDVRDEFLRMIGRQ